MCMTWPLRADRDLTIETAGMNMIMWMCGVYIIHLKMYIVLNNILSNLNVT